MKKTIFFLASLCLFSCQISNKEEDKTDLIKQDVALLEEAKDCNLYFKNAKKADSVLLVATILNKNDAVKALDAFTNFTTFCKTDSLTPVFLLKGGQVAQSIGKYTQAQSFFKKCVDDFPMFKNRGAALFLLANLYDDSNMLNNEVEAKVIYEKIMQEYPKTDWARDAKASLNNLGKTDEQLVQEFLKKNK